MMADRFFGTMLVIPRALVQACVVADTPNTAVPPVWSRPRWVVPALLAVPVRERPSCVVPGVDVWIAQSWPRIVAPSRHRAARTNTRLTLPLPARLAAMQKGKHGAVGMQAVSPFSALSCPHLGISQTVASSSRHVPLEMQSCVGSADAWPVVPSVTVLDSYRV